MCGRYQLELSLDDILNIIDVLDEVREKYQDEDLTEYTHEKRDIFPGSQAVVLTNEGLKKPIWGFPLDKKLVFNARSESIFEKPMFRKAASENRCLVPANLFYEWQGKEKIKHMVRTPDSIMYLGGVLEKYAAKDGTVEERFSIITEASENEMASIHPRTPLIIKKEDLRSFMNPGSSLEEVRRIMKSYPEKLIITREDRDAQLSIF
ncbi:SOS response-associated peptidase [Proteiniclasticum sp.]|uniref:SOS response-associated peptidase n=1 Tax=Proteiniclasticum sp. TaxID=2053595 RepID=UPI002898F698|nr:SOS response-associated peptidase [Proteiniclasticum sp.]